MNGFFYTLLITSVCGTVCTLLAFGGFEKYIKYIASLACTAVIINTVLSIDLSGLNDTVSEGLQSLPAQDNLYTITERLTETQAEEYINQIVFSEFGIKPIYCDIEINWDGENAVIQKISVALCSDDLGFAGDTKKYLLDVLGGEVEIVEAE